MKTTLFRNITIVSIVFSALSLAVLPVGVRASAPTINEILAQISASLSALQAQVGALTGAQTVAPATPVTPVGTPAFTFTRNLYPRMSGEDVKALQNFLKETGHFPIGHASTGFFGPTTQRAVAAWQTANGIPANGFFEMPSRERYNQIMNLRAQRPVATPPVDIPPHERPPLSPPRDLQLTREIALSLLGMKECNPGPIEANPEGPTRCILDISYVGAKPGIDQDPQVRWTHFWNVTATTDRLMDDSVAAHRIQATVAHFNGRWITWRDPYRTFKCVTGRGHSFFASGPLCI